MYSLSQKFEGKNRMGGIIEIQFGFVDATTRTYPTVFYPVRFTRESAKFEEKQKNGTGGTTWQSNLKLKKAQVETSVLLWLTWHSHKLFICRIRYANGTIREIGTTEYPLECLTSNSSGKKAGDRNEVAFRFRGEGITPAKVIQSTTTITTMPTPESYDGGATKEAAFATTDPIAIASPSSYYPIVQVIDDNGNLQICPVIFAPDKTGFVVYPIAAPGIVIYT